MLDTKYSSLLAILQVVSVAHLGVARVLPRAHRNLRQFLQFRRRFPLCWELAQGAPLPYISPVLVLFAWRSRAPHKAVPHAEVFPGHPLCYPQPCSSLAPQVSMALDAARGLQALHEAPGGPIVHLDIKPQQMMLDKDGRVRINDLNTCRFLDADTDGNSCPYAASAMGVGVCGCRMMHARVLIVCSA